MDRATLQLFHDAQIPPDFFEDFLAAASGADLPVSVESREVGPTGGIEWLLPTAIIIFFGKPFVDALLKRVADDVADAIYPRIKDGIAGLAKKVLIATRYQWKRITASGEIPREGPSPFFSIVAETTSQKKLKFVFHEEKTEIEYDECVERALQLVVEHHDDSSDDPLLNAPVDTATNTIYMMFDEHDSVWRPIDVMDEIRKERLKSEGRKRQQPPTRKGGRPSISK